MPASLKLLTSKRVNYYSLLARWKDGLYYTASLLKCDSPKKRCLVCFEDGSELWANNRDLHIQLSLDQLKEDEDILCCVCDDGCSDDPNLIIICDVCNQGYHQRCHNPVVDKSAIDGIDDHKDWICATCSYILRQKDRAQLNATAQQRQQQQKQEPQKQQQEIPPPQQQKRPAETSPQIQKKLQQERPESSVETTSPTTIVRQPAKVKQTPVIQPQQTVMKSSIGPVKATPINNNSPQKQVPHYPLSGQVRVIASSSTAALASMTASSALVVGSSSGRTKQDLVNQSNKSSQRQARQLIGNVQSEAAIAQGPPKHAVRKSSVNFAPSPVRQSALPTATRSPLPSGNNSTTIQSKVIPSRTNIITTIASAKPATSIIVVDNNNCISKPSSALSSPSPVRINPINNQGVSNTNLSPRLAISPVAVGPSKLVTSSSMSDAQVVSTSAPVISNYKSAPTVINQSNSASNRTIVLSQQGREQKAHSTTSSSPAVTTSTTNVEQVKNDQDDGASDGKIVTNSDVTSNSIDNREAS